MISTYTSDKNIAISLSISNFCFSIGFAHEEEFMILSLAAGLVNPLLLMIVYALSVSVALIGITIL